ERQPDTFSPNVLLRPAVESALLPTLAYVAGPGELAYFAPIGRLFRAHGIEPALGFPRHSVTRVGPTVRRLLDRHGPGPASVRPRRTTSPRARPRPGRTDAPASMRASAASARHPGRSTAR